MHSLHSLEDIERAISGLAPQDLDKLYDWLKEQRPARLPPNDPNVLASGLGLFGNADEARLLDEVVDLAYEERRRPTRVSG